MTSFSSAYADPLCAYVALKRAAFQEYGTPPFQKVSPPGPVA